MYYFAYGSNLLVARLQARTPSARLITRARLRGFTPRFHKVGDDGSGKGDAFHTGKETDFVEGVVYHLNRDDLVILDRIEGVGNGYTRESCRLDSDQGTLEAWVYVAESFRIDPAVRPFHWYKRFVVGGAREHQFEAGYIEHLTSVPSQTDPDWSRASHHHRLLRQHARHHFADWPLRDDLEQDH